MISVYTASTPRAARERSTPQPVDERLDGGGEQDGQDQQEQHFLHLPQQKAAKPHAEDNQRGARHLEGRELDRERHVGHQKQAACHAQTACRTPRAKRRSHEAHSGVPTGRRGLKRLRRRAARRRRGSALARSARRRRPERDSRPTRRRSARGVVQSHTARHPADTSTRSSAAAAPSDPARHHSLRQQTRPHADLRGGSMHRCRARIVGSVHLQAPQHLRGGVVLARAEQSRQRQPWLARNV